jgi:glucose/arabinose dehydrogenase
MRLASGRTLLVLAVCLALLPAVPAAGQVEAPTSPPPPGARTFPETGQWLAGAFLSAWEQGGGLARFGFPISPPLDPGDGTTIQWTERARFEYHPSFPAGQRVLLGLLGREVTRARGGQAPFLAVPDPADGSWFPETGHTLRHGFRAYWEAHGGLVSYGFPISEEFAEVNPIDGQTYTVQYFERARFEYHPEHKGTPYEVELGHLGRQQYAGGGTVAPAPEEGTAPAPPFDAGRVILGVEEIAGGLRQPLFVTHAGDGSGRLFVVEKAGRIRLLPDGQLFLDIAERVGSAGSEQGLLGLAFHPRFRDIGFFYVNYTDRAGDTVIARFSLTADGRGDPGSEHRLLTQDQPAPNHNGGMLAFGPDGYLYIGLGDGGGANDQFRNAQNRQSVLGKILRVDVDGGDPYAIPLGNPFVGDPGARPEIWAYGLRNPWRFSFDRATGDLYIGDVGQNQREWVYFQPAGSGGGQNYGWPIVEGSRCLSGGDCDRRGLTPPVAEYTHAQGCAITGGYVYRGARSPLLRGAYLYGDYCSGRVWTLARDGAGQWVATEMLRLNARISSFGEDEAGEVYLTDLGGGTVARVTARPRP